MMDMFFPNNWRHHSSVAPEPPVLLGSELHKQQLSMKITRISSRPGLTIAMVRNHTMTLVSCVYVEIIAAALLGRFYVGH